MQALPQEYSSEDFLVLNKKKEEEIIYIKAEGNYSWICYPNSRMKMVAKNLRNQTKSLPGYFVRVHHSFLVNFNYIYSIDLRMNTLLLYTGEKIPLSHRKKKAIIDYVTSNVKHVL